MRAISAAVVVVAITVSGPAVAQDDECRVMEFHFTPAERAQTVIWLEDAAGNYLETVYITQATGSYGLGNRPGFMEFNSAWAWPYGRRISVAPVWAHRHGHEWPRVVFQNLDDSNLSHPLGHSSKEAYYCRPFRPGERAWDTETCASVIYTDKGALSESETSKYPPRADHTLVPGTDDPSVADMRGLNPFDAVSRATPIGGMAQRVVWSIPDGLPAGDYVAWVEVNTEYDQNEFYDYPSPTGIPWSDYGIAYRGQPSVLYRIDFSLRRGTVTAMTSSYFGYGDPDGLTGELAPPDTTITENLEGSGASRLLLTTDDDGTYRFKVVAHPTDDKLAPSAVTEFVATELSPTSVRASFVAPGNDGDEGLAAGYSIRASSSGPLTDENFDEADELAVAVDPEPAGFVHDLYFSDLEPNTIYHFGIRAYDECLNEGPLTVLAVQTPRHEAGEVDACFVATAAFGSAMQADVARLRRFRDVALRTHLLGEIAVVSYYTFGPALAGVISPSDTLREFARATLRPLVRAVRRFAR